MKGKIIVTALTALFVLSLAAPVFATTGYNLMAGQFTDVGDIYVETVGTTNLHIQLVLDPSWQVIETHIAVATDPALLPQTPNGNPKVGLFPYAYGSGIVDFTIPSPASSGTVYIALHCVVQSTGTCQQETAWGGNCALGGGTVGSFPGASWATYLIYTIGS